MESLWIIRCGASGTLRNPVYVYWTGNAPSTDRGAAARMPLAQAKRISDEIRAQRVYSGRGCGYLELLRA